MRIEGPVAVSYVFRLAGHFWKHLDKKIESLKVLIVLLLFQVVQLLETPFVNLINFASLVTTNAARHRFVAGKNKLLLEFGLRRAQVLDTFF